MTKSLFCPVCGRWLADLDGIAAGTLDLHCPKCKGRFTFDCAGRRVYRRARAKRDPRQDLIDFQRQWHFAEPEAPAETGRSEVRQLADFAPENLPCG